MANFTEDHRTENWLKLRGVKFEYRAQVRFDELAPNWFSVNQGRPDSVPKDDLLIEKYAGAMDQGAIFPSPILAKTPAGLEVLDGCQRLSAADLCGQKLFNAYVIKTDNPSIRASVRICANSVLNGTSPSQEWTIGKIVDVLYEQYDFGVEDCSQWSGQPAKRIQEEIESRDAKLWLKIHNVDVSQKPANQKGFLAALSRLAPMLDREKLTKELPDLVNRLISIKANNDEAVNFLTQCLDVERRPKADLAVQVRSRIAEVLERPEIIARMTGQKKNHPVDNALHGMAGAVTRLRTAARGEYHTDRQQSEQLLGLVEEARKLAKRIIPKEQWAKLAETNNAELVAS
jgi:hypothetical protein